MVKTFKYILTRIVIGVGIALILMYLKGGLIADVHALQVKSFSTSNNSNYASCQNCNIINESWNWNSGLTNVGGYLNMNLAITSSASSADIISTPVIVRVKADDFWFNCSINGVTNNNLVMSTAPNLIQAIYSLSCPVQLGNNGQFQNIYIQVNGHSASYLSLYSPINFVYDDGNSTIVSAIEDNTDAINETNDTLKDDSIDDSKAESDIDDMKDKVASNGSITQLLTLPITLYQSILNSLNGSCSSFSLGSLYNHNLTLPCINLQNLLGSTLYNIIDILCCGSFILVFRKRMVDIFNHMTSLNDRGNEVE